MDTNTNLDTTFYKYLNKYNEIIKKYDLNTEQNQVFISENLSSEQNQNSEQTLDPGLSRLVQARTESGSTPDPVVYRPEQSRDQDMIYNDTYHDNIFRYTINRVLFRSDVSEERSLPEQTRRFSPIPQHRRGSLPDPNQSLIQFNDTDLVRACTRQDIEGYKSRIYNVIVFLKKYPNLLNILPDENMTSRRIKFFLMSSYNELFFDKDVFLNVWMDFFKWKLTYSDLNDPPCR